MILMFATVLASPPESPPARASGSIRHFHHTVETSATPEAIWSRWTDPASWHTWDRGLEAASLSENTGPDGAMQLGSSGTLVSGGRETPFVVTRFDVQGAARCVAFASDLPLGSLVVTRSLDVVDGRTRFTHDVQLRGFGGWLLAPMLGPGFRRMLPGVMSDLARAAEESGPSLP